MSSAPGTIKEGLPQPGDLLAGKYRVERMIGRGGMGVVYCAEYEMLAQRVAIKLLLAEIVGIPEAVQRFHNEARAAAQIQSEHVARVMELGTLDTGVPFMVMEYLEGDDLGQLLEKRGPLPAIEAVDHALQALEAIALAHARGIVHRDLKPANLFLARRTDGSTIVKVLDFGISKATNPLSPGSGGMTSTKAMLGSPYYMSPEQLRSSKSVRAQTDIWSMGVILHELLTGSVPFRGENMGELFAAILEQPPAPVRTRRPDVDPDLEQIILRCLERNPAQRYASAAELSQALARHGSPRSQLAVERTRMLQNAVPAATTNPHAASVYMPPSGPAMVAQVAARLPPSQAYAPAASGPGGPLGPSTAAAWGQTGSPANAPGSSKTPLFVLAALVLLALLGGAGAFAWHRTRVVVAAAADASPPPSTATTLAAAPTTLAPSVLPAKPATPPEAPPMASTIATTSPEAAPALQPVAVVKPRPAPPTPIKPTPQPIAPVAVPPVTVSPPPPPPVKPAGGIPGDGRH